MNVFAPLQIKRPIGLAYNMNEDDVWKTKSALDRLGLSSSSRPFAATPYPDASLIENLKAFQRRQGLRPDGVMRPGGPTLRRINHALRETETNDVASDHRRRAGPGDGPVDGNGGPAGQEPDGKPEPEEQPQGCQRLAVERANAEQAARENRERADDYDQEFEKWQAESKRLTQQLKDTLTQLAIEVAIPAWGAVRNLRKLLERPSLDTLTAAQALHLNEQLEQASLNTRQALDQRTFFEDAATGYEAESRRIHKKMQQLGCAG